MFGVVLNDALHVAVVVLGVDPELPVQELEELPLQKIHFLNVDATDVGYEVVAVEDVVIKLGSEQGGS